MRVFFCVTTFPMLSFSGGWGDRSPGIQEALFFFGSHWNERENENGGWMGERK
jgi:hypothetical protein